MICRAHAEGWAVAADKLRQRHRSPASSARIPQLALAHQHWTAALIFAIVVLVYLWPALVEGHPLIPASALYQVAPWSHAVPSDIHEYFNPSLVDAPASYYAWDVLARHYVHNGVFPAWNPYAFAGTPFWANPEVAWLSPFTWTKWVLPLNYSLGVVAAVKLWLAGFGMYLLIRELRLAFWPGIVAGLSFAFCTFNIVWLSYGVHVTVAVMLPWAIWLGERVVRRGRSADALALAGVVALVMTGGHPGTQLHVMSALVLYVLLRAVLARDVSRGARLRRLGLVGAALAIGTLLAAATLLPAQQAATDTAGAIARRNGSGGFPGSNLSFEALRAVLFPDWWGRPSEADAGGPANYSERALFAGVIAILLASVALISSGGWRRKAPFAVLGSLGLAVGLRAPVIRDTVVNAPLFDMVQNQRLLLLFLFGIGVLAAFGLEAVLDVAAGQRRAWTASGVAIAGAAVVALSVPTGSGTWSGAREWFLRRSGSVAEGVLPLASVGWFLVPVFAFVAFLGVMTWRPAWRRPAAPLLAGAVALEMLHFAHGFQPMGPATRAIPPRTPAIEFLQARRHEGRIAGVGYTLANDWTTIYGLRDARGYDAPQPSLRFHKLWRTMSPEQSTHTSYAFRVLSPESQRVMSLLGVRLIVMPPGENPVRNGLTTVYRAPDATVVENAHAAPRAFVAQRVRAARATSEEVSVVLEHGFDPLRDAVVQQHELPKGVDPKGIGHGTARLIADANARVALRTVLTRPGVVILNDAWASGWSVTVDGRRAPALQTDVVLRGVLVPAGEHEVVWTYHVPGLRAGVALSAMGALAAAFWCYAALIQRRRLRTP